MDGLKAGGSSPSTLREFFLRQLFIKRQWDAFVFKIACIKTPSVGRISGFFDHPSEGLQVRQVGWKAPSLPSNKDEKDI